MTNQPHVALDAKALEAALREEAEALDLDSQGTTTATVLMREAADALAALSQNPGTSKMSGEAEPVAWIGYWPGAGSIDSVTRTTHLRHVAEKWKLDGAEVTPLAALEPRASDRERTIEECAKVADAEAERLRDQAKIVPDVSPSADADRQYLRALARVASGLAAAIRKLSEVSHE